MTDRAAVCPECGGLDAIYETDGIICGSCGFISHESIDRFYGR